MTVHHRMTLQRRTDELDAGLGLLLDAVAVMIAELSVGAHPARACRQAADDVSRGGVGEAGAVAGVLTQMAGRAELGGDVAEGIQGAGLSHQSSWDRVAVAWRTAERHGLPMADLLGAVRDDLVARRRFAERTRAALAGARATAAVLALLPLLGIGLGQAMGARAAGHPVRRGHRGSAAGHRRLAGGHRPVVDRTDHREGDATVSGRVGGGRSLRAGRAVDHPGARVAAVPDCAAAENRPAGAMARGLQGAGRSVRQRGRLRPVRGVPALGDAGGRGGRDRVALGAGRHGADAASGVGAAGVGRRPGTRLGGARGRAGVVGVVERHGPTLGAGGFVAGAGSARTGRDRTRSGEDNAAAAAEPRRRDLRTARSVFPARVRLPGHRPGGRRIGGKASTADCCDRRTSRRNTPSRAQGGTSR